jgi:NADH-quinone oxidoreductase subunit F
MAATILKGPRGVPPILLGRLGKYEPDQPAADLARAEKAGAWAAWKSALTTLSPQALVRIVDDARLTGRGGAGYRTAAKWRAAGATETADVRYVVANGFEADPGAQRDRILLEQDPHLVVEGTALAAYAIGAARAYIAVAATRTQAIRRLTAAVEAATEAGYIGPDALGSGFDLLVEVVPVMGGLVVGEETTLLRAIENKRAQPDQRPPYPSGRGLWGRPTVVNNVATLAALPWIVEHGAAAFADIGDPEQPGTMLVQFSGAIARPGIVEVPMGMAVGKLIDLAGGAAQGELKAVLVGGPTGGFLPPAAFKTLYTPAALSAAGAVIGSGTIVAVGQGTCLVDMATLLLRYSSDESCGKTIPCRIGLRRLYELGRRATTGLSRPTDAQLLTDLAADVRDGALCQLEYLAPSPLTSGLRYFAQEFEDHFIRGACPAGVCRTVPLAIQPVSA